MTISYKEQIADTVTEKDINKMVQSFDKAWSKFCNEHGASLDNRTMNRPEGP